MRVSFNSFSTDIVSQLGGLMSQQTKLQTQVSTGQRIQSAEDDPAAMATILDSQAQGREISQYRASISRQQQAVTASYSAIKSLKTLSDRASEIATLASGVKTADDLSAYTAEIDGMISNAVQLGNSKDQGNYLFGGTNGTKPFEAATDGDGKVTSVSYQGNTSVNQFQIAGGTLFSIPVVGANSTGSGARGVITDSASGADFITHLIQLRDDLKSGNQANIGDVDAGQLQADGDNLIYHIGLSGALQTRLEAADSMLKDQAQDLNTQVSDASGADIASTVVQLSQAQTAYQAALQSSSKLLSTSLMDYIR
jgi:flagellar hook-associated protein 3 FlgL